MEVKFWLCIDYHHKKLTLHIEQCRYVQNRKKDSKTTEWMEYLLEMVIGLDFWYPDGKAAYPVFYCRSCFPETHFS